MNAGSDSVMVSVPDARVLPAVRKLLVLRLRIMFNSFRRAKVGSKIGILILYTFLLGFGVLIFWLSRLLLNFVRSPEMARVTGLDFTSVLASIPALILSVLFVGTLFTSFGVLLQAMYLAGDMDFLIATPVPIRAVFVAKLLQAVIPNFAIMALLGLPILFGLGAASGYGALYYPLVMLVMIALALAAAGLASLLVMLVVRVMSPRRAAEILAFFGALFGFACSQLGNFANIFGKNIHVSSTRLTGILLLAETRWLPLNWAGQGLVELGQNHWVSGILLLGATLGVAAGVFVFALLTAEQLYYSGWAGMQVVARKKTNRPARRSNGGRANVLGLGIARLFSRPVLGIVQKDYLTLRRDLRNVAGLITPVILGIVYTFSLLRSGGEPPAGRGEAPTWFMDSFQMLLAYGNVLMSLFVGWMVLSRLAGMGFSQEGRNYWVLRASPVRPGQLLTAKFLVAYLPAVAMGLVFLLVISFVQGFSAGQFLYSLVIMLMCQAGTAGILLAFGAVGANFTWDDPRKMNAGSMGCLGQVATMLYLPVAFGAFVLPLAVAGFLGLSILYGYLAGLLLGLAVTVTGALVPLWLVRSRVEQLGQQA
ncbi:MAG: putative ABC transporter permease subunit [Bacteroidota bacterium]